MLKTVSFTEKFNKTQPCALLLGGFDGVHIGHRLLVERARKCGLPVGIMSISGGKGETDLFTFSEREEIFSSLGLDFAFEMPFSEIRDMQPKDFADLLTHEFAPRAFFCGRDFRFGKNAKGTPEFLEEYTHVSVDISELLFLNGEKVGATSVKQRLKQGDVAGAAELLGAPFFLTGVVIEDRHVGRAIGFPTANILYPSEKFPLKRAVYEALVNVDGRDCRGIVNFGARPTFDNDRVLTETYLDGFDGNLYGRTLSVRFIRFLREIKKFDGAEALKNQLKTDIERVRNHD